MRNLKLNANLDFLSPLEKDVLRILWPSKQLKVKDIYVQLSKKRNVALSSVAVILDRLYVHKLVDRVAETARGGVRYIYSPLHTEEKFKRSVVETTVNQLISSFGSIAMTYFDERFAKKKKKE